MIEDLMKHPKTTFTIDEELVNELFRSPFFEDLEEISTTVKIKEHKHQVTIMRTYQCGIGIYQLAKLHILEFYYDFLDKYLDWHDFEWIQMDTDSMYMAISGEFDEIVRPELREEYDHGGKAKFLSMSKYHDRTLRLFKAKFQGMRMIALMSKCYYAENGKENPRLVANV